MVRAKGEDVGYTPIDGGVTCHARGPLAAISDDMLAERVRVMLTSVADDPASSGECGIGGTVVVDHCVRVKAAVNELY